MDKAIFDLAELVARSDNPIAALLWMAFVGFLLLLPSLGTLLSRFRYGQIFATHLVALGLVPIFYLASAPALYLLFPKFTRGHFGYFTSMPLLHLAALGLVAIWGWLQALQERQKGSKTNVADINRNLTRGDLITLTRLALWLTLSLMPTIKWS